MIEPARALPGFSQIKEKFALGFSRRHFDDAPVTQHVLVDLGLDPVYGERHQPDPDVRVEAAYGFHQPDVAFRLPSAMVAETGRFRRAGPCAKITPLAKYIVGNKQKIMMYYFRDNDLYQHLHDMVLNSDIPVLRVIAIFILLHCVAHYLVLPYLDRKVAKKKTSKLTIVTHHHFFHRMVLTLQGAVLAAQLSFISNPHHEILAWILTGARIWTLTFALLAFYAFIDVICDLLKTNLQFKGLPYHGLQQSLKLAGAVIYSILLISLLVDKSPLILFSGLSAIAAVLLLVFKDPLLGLVAGIQLAANDMLQPGDWIELDSLGANGSVQDIGLTTVKVLNFDNTITTIPTYTLVSGSFKNWRYMVEHGARRIQRTINVDIATVRILTPEGKQAIVNHDALASLMAADSAAKTNIELFQEYAKAWLAQHPAIRTDMTLMVRQLPSTTYGLPVEFYAFASQTEWVAYEQLQSEIFSHLMGIISLFDLKIHQLS